MYLFNTMNRIERYVHIGTGVFIATVVVMLALFIAGFILPPVGVIDQSVIRAGAELVSLAVIAQLPMVIKYINIGRAIKISKGDLSIETTQPEVK